jgi:2-iminobutanoate/2-iminopropanoate deaminase
VGDDIAAQTEQVLKNLSGVLEAGGSSLARVIKTTVFLRTMDDFAAMNGVYGRYFAENPPARTTVAVVGLPLNALVEIEAVGLAD